MQSKVVKMLIFVVLCMAVLLSETACKTITSNEDVKSQSKNYYEYFHTVSSVFSYAGDTPEVFEANAELVRAELEKYHCLFDIYYEYSGVNNLCTVNKNAGGEPVAVNKELIDFLLYAKEMHELTEGKTNIAIGALTSLWHDCREEAERNPALARLPDEQALLNAMAHTSISSLVIDQENNTVTLTDPDASVDVGAIGKGYAVERIAELLSSRGVSSYVLNIGGNIRAIGTKTNGDGWITGITNPDTASDERFVCRIELANTSLVTSGNYERYYTVSGIKYHHIIDERTRYPAGYFASVSILTEDSGLADALSTALFCMPYEDGLSLIQQIGGVEVLWVFSDGSTKMTEGFRALIK